MKSRDLGWEMLMTMTNPFYREIITTTCCQHLFIVFYLLRGFSAAVDRKGMFYNVFKCVWFISSTMPISMWNHWFYSCGRSRFLILSSFSSSHNWRDSGTDGLQWEPNNAHETWHTSAHIPKLFLIELETQGKLNVTK